MKIPTWQMESDLELFNNLSVSTLIQSIAICHRIKTVIPDYVSTIKELERTIRELQEKLNAKENNS